MAKAKKKSKKKTSKKKTAKKAVKKGAKKKAARKAAPVAPMPSVEKIGRVAAVAERMSALPVGVNPPVLGSQTRIWKQDPSVGGLGVREVYIHTRSQTGPRDSQIEIQGLPPVTPSVNGDFLIDPTSDEAFDAVHTYTVVRQTLTLFQRVLDRKLGWQWNSGANTDPIRVFPRFGEAANAFYSRSQKALQFFFFTPPGAPPGGPKIFTCRSLDIVAHEAGHAVLDSLKPNWLLSPLPQTGGLHESFGDLTAIFLAMSQLDLVEHLVAQTKADLHQKNFLADVAEEFGAGIGRPNGLRNADNDLKLSDVGNQVHEISQIFTGGVYDVLADAFTAKRDPRRVDDALTLYRESRYLFGLVLRGIEASPGNNATYADVARAMISAANADGRTEVAGFVQRQFARREVLGAAASLAPPMPGDRRGCCGTMQHSEYLPAEGFWHMA